MTARAARILTAIGMALPLFVAGAPPSSAQESVVLTDVSFVPEQIVVGVGETVTWTHADGQIPHTVTADDGSFDSNPTCEGALQTPANCMTEGDTYSRQFDSPGTVPYFCKVHPSTMTGEVVVRAADPTTTTTEAAASPTTSAPPAPDTTGAAADTTAPPATQPDDGTEESTTTSTGADEATTSSSTSTTQPGDEAAADGNGNGGGGVALLLVVLVLVAAGGGVLLWRFRPRPSGDE